jgi:hypothetical protein
MPMNRPTRLILLLAFPLSVFVSCASDSQEPQGTHLSPEKMEALLFDLQLADIYSTMARPDTAAASNVRDADSLAFFYTEILAHHGVTAELFNLSMDWYESHPAQLEPITTRISDRLAALSGEKE